MTFASIPEEEFALIATIQHVANPAFQFHTQHSWHGGIGPKPSKNATKRDLPECPLESFL